MVCHFSDFKKTFDIEIYIKICADRQHADICVTSVSNVRRLVVLQYVFDFMTKKSIKGWQTEL
jgi:hypothetical protein